MQFRTILEGVFASPITVVSSVVIIVCAGVLVVNISSTIIASSDMDNTSIDVRGKFTEGSNNNSLNLQQSDAIPKITFNRGQSSPDSDTLNSTNRQRNQGSSNSKGYSNRDDVNSDSRPFKENHNSYKRKTTYDNFSELPTTSNDSFSDDISHGTPSLNFSNSNSTVGIDTSGTTSTTNNHDSSVKDSSNDTHSSIGESAITSGVGTDTEPEKVFPVSSESTVKIDLDETQTISCRPVTENGPPCMCTITITDANGSFSELLNNCN